MSKISPEFLHEMSVYLQDKKKTEDYNMDYYIHDLYEKIRELEKRIKDLEDANKKED